MELWEGQGVTVGPVLDLELPDNAGVTGMALDVRTASGEATVTIECRGWDDPVWFPLAIAHVGKYDEKTVTATVDPERELLRYSIRTAGTGPFYCIMSIEEDI